MVTLNFKAEEIKLPCDYNSLSAGQRRVVRQIYVNRQGHRCYHCDKNLAGAPAPSVMRARIDWSKFPDNFLGHPVHLHHDHESGMTLGAVHARCNAYLWQYLGE